MPFLFPAADQLLVTGLYVYQAVSFPAQLLRWQRRRLHRLQEELLGETPVPSHVLPFAPTPITGPPPAEQAPLEPTEVEGQETVQLRQRLANYPFVD